MFKRGQLRTFITVAEEGQLTRAAAKLHVAQPAVSQSISQLESELDVVLFERQARGVTLTHAGEVFLPKARAALAAADDAAATAKAIARAARGNVDLGFVGSPPTLHCPELLEALELAHPEIELSVRELTFPCTPTVAWLSEVDLALCHPPAPDPEICIQTLWSEPRVAIAPRSHPLAGRDEVSVAELLDETFLGFHPDVEPSWAGFWRLDDYRAEPSARVTADATLTPTEMVGIIASGAAITTVPACHAQAITKLLPSVAVIAIQDARPATLSLVWRKDNHNPLVHALNEAAGEFADGAVARGATAGQDPTP
jgi:DNA-binding transcriptional LysR family regulator